VIRPKTKTPAPAAREWIPSVGQRVLHPVLGGGVVAVNQRTTGNGNCVVKFYRDGHALEGPANSLRPDLRRSGVIQGGLTETRTAQEGRVAA
jgi:uncharacterized protein YjhX (UPF0386 family)